MFQRQLSTNALTGAQGGGGGGGVGSGAASTGAGRQVSGAGPRLFQRQMTASQLFSSSSGGNPAHADSGNFLAGHSVAALRQQLRGGNSQSSASPNPSRAIQSASQTGGRASNRLADAIHASDGSGEQPKKAAKNRRIISRMLSISAIHTSGSSELSSAGSTGSCSTQQQQPGGSPLSTPHHHHHHAAAPGASDSLTYTEAANGATRSGNNSINLTNSSGHTTNDFASDKFDSSFTRSRSSSGSSSAAANELAMGQQQAKSSADSILCLCFLDWTQSSQVAQQQAAAAAAAAANLSSSQQPADHKSASSPIDQSTPAGQLSLWLGTSAGSVLMLNLEMPDSEDNRVLQLQSIIAEPIPQAALKMPGSILCLNLFVSEASRPAPGMQGAPTSGSQSSSLESDALTSGIGGSGTPLERSSAGQFGPGSSNGPSDAAPGPGRGGPADSSSSSSHSFDSRIAYFFAVISEKQARVYQIPQQQLSNLVQPSAAASSASSSLYSQAGAKFQQQPICESPMAKLLTNKQNCVAKSTLSDSSYAARSQIVQMRQPDESCLVSYLATGNLVVHSLPKLRLLYDVDFVPYSNARLAQSMCFSRNGHCLYQPSPSEISKFTLGAQYRSYVGEMIGSLYVPKEMPEMPRANFFKSLFSVATSSAKQSDRDELFGECSSGKATRGVAKLIGGGPTPSGLDKLKGAAVGTMGHEMRMAREGLDERGEKLSEIEDKTLQMMNQAESYSQAAHNLAQRFKDKKWYQF